MSSTTVTVVIDGEFGKRLRALVSTSLWIVDSTTSLDALRRIRQSESSFRATTFRAGSGSASEELADLLPTVDLHHGVFSQTPRYDRLLIYGARPNQAVLAALSSIGFALEIATADGFSAVRSPSA